MEEYSIKTRGQSLDSNAETVSSNSIWIFCLATYPHRCVLARFITETTGPRHNNKDYFCTMFSILKALCACTLPPLTCRCSKVDVSQIHMVNPVNDLKIAHIIACLGIFLWVQNLKLDIWTLETFLNMKKHMNAIICQKFIRKKIRKNFDLSDFLDFGY